MVKLLFLEGNIGSGKSTSLEYLRSRFSDSSNTQEPIFVLEPVDDWQNLTTLEGQPVNLLNAFYRDIPKYGFCFQTYAFLSRMKILLETLKQAEDEGRTWVICERSIFTDREIFLECLYENGSITSEERAVYHQLWDFWNGLLQPFFKNIEIHFLYVNCSAENAMTHIRSRSRLEETDLSLDYLKMLHSKHQHLYSSISVRLNSLTQVLSQKQVSIYDVNNEGGLKKLYEQLDQIISNILVEDEQHSFWKINPRQIWNYWDMFWDIN